MTFRQRLGLSIPPYLLRLALAATFIWSGAVKFQSQIQLSPQEEVTYTAIRDGSAATAPKAPAEDSAEPTDTSQPAGADGESSAALTGPILLLVQDTSPKSDAPASDSNKKKDAAHSAPTPPRTHAFIARLTLMIHDAATPDDKGRALLPAFAASGKWPLWLAYTASLTELIGGVAILLGLFTRLWALGLTINMATALWMTSIGPVVIMGAPGWPSFMPLVPAINGYAISAWQMWLWQFILAAGALSLACLGAGSISLDRLFFKKRSAPVDTPDETDS